MIFCKNDKLTVRDLEQKDKLLLVKWLSDSEVLKYYEGRNNPHDEKMVEESFYTEDIEKTRCIIEYLKSPIGYIQFYPLGKEQRVEYGYANFKGNIFGTDQFIGETKYWGQGIGKELMKLIIEFLETVRGAQMIVLDPQAWNERAIKCYEKSGFKKVKLMPKHELHEGELKDCWLMEYVHVLDI
jgi:aminoglycoside 6'-N-acetyltransferase